MLRCTISSNKMKMTLILMTLTSVVGSILTEHVHSKLCATNILWVRWEIDPNRTYLKLKLSHFRKNYSIIKRTQLSTEQLCFRLFLQVQDSSSSYIADGDIMGTDPRLANELGTKEFLNQYEIYNQTISPYITSINLPTELHMLHDYFKYLFWVAINQLDGFILGEMKHNALWPIGVVGNVCMCLFVCACVFVCAYASLVDQRKTIRHKSAIVPLSCRPPERLPTTYSISDVVAHDHNI